MQWVFQVTYYIRPPYQDWESKQIYIIHRNKHNEAAKWGEREQDPNERTRKFSRRRAKQNRGKQLTIYRVQSNDYKDAERMNQHIATIKRTRQK